MIQLKIFVFVALLVIVFGKAVTGQQIEFRFSEPELLRTNDGKVIEIESGMCAPFPRDMDGDGRVDLLVGEFGTVFCPGYEEEYKQYVQGRCRVYRDVKRQGKPELLPFQWLEAENEPLYVPITCCVCMSTAFVDMNGDGLEDLVSGSFPGELYWWLALPDGSWGKRQVVVDENENVIKVGNATTVFAADMNGDGVTDLLVNALYDGMFWIENRSAKNEVARLRLLPERVRTIKGTELVGCYAIMEDLDGDGRSDLIYGDKKGWYKSDCKIFWCRNTGTGFEEPQVLITFKDINLPVELGDSVKRPGGSPRFCVCDWDGDGKKDFVVCTETTVKKQRHISAGDLEKKADLEKKLNNVRKKWEKFQGKAMKVADVETFHIGNVPFDRLPQRLVEKFRPVDRGCCRLSAKLREFDEFYTRTTGYIWVYYRQ